MFDDVTLTTKKPLDRDYAAAPHALGAAYEVTQMKGDGETHPALSPTTSSPISSAGTRAASAPEPKTPDMLPREYAREALKRGLAYEAKLGVNPFKFGMVGSTDSHTVARHHRRRTTSSARSCCWSLRPTRSASTKSSLGASRRSASSNRTARETSASGLAAVWARDNTREALWDAMARKEVYATTGTRLMVRVFGGFDFTAEDLDAPTSPSTATSSGVPMGGDLKAAPAGKAPRFLIRALRDADGANLDRVQVVKGWLDAAGKTHEKVYDVAWSGDRKPGADGKLPPVGNTVNVKDASYTNAIGAPYLTRTGRTRISTRRARLLLRARDRDSDAALDDLRRQDLRREAAEDVPASIQDRAYTSPIWYTP